MDADEKKFEWGPHSLRAGMSFDMYDGRTATLIAHGRTPFEWLVMFSDSTSNVLTEEFILDRLNGQLKESGSDGTQAG